jgi:hypothetical protein
MAQRTAFRSTRLRLYACVNQNARALSGSYPEIIFRPPNPCQPRKIFPGGFHVRSRNGAERFPVESVPRLLVRCGFMAIAARAHRRERLGAVWARRRTAGRRRGEGMSPNDSATNAVAYDLSKLVRRRLNGTSRTKTLHSERGIARSDLSGSALPTRLQLD